MRFISNTPPESLARWLTGRHLAAEETAVVRYPEPGTRFSARELADLGWVSVWAVND